MNVTELSSNLYQRAGISSTDILKLRSTRRSDRPASLGADRSEGPRFSDVLAALTEKNRPQAASSVSERTVTTESEPDEPSAPALTQKDARALLRDALNSETIPNELVSALSDDSGNLSDALLDLIFQEDDEENTDLSLMGETSSSDTLNNILTDAQKAQSYLSSQSGRDLMVALAQNSISGIIANT
ncbi:MAG: hypothetical protein IJ600_07175 [Lachnospiraceae bacterium]|nr:hypothetical protein [Lachnospiraceae bacterium]